MSHPATEIAGAWGQKPSHGGGRWPQRLQAWQRTFRRNRRSGLG